MILIALLLIVEGLSTGLWLARILPVLGAFGAVATGLAVMRGLVGATQLAGGVFLIGGRPAAGRLSQLSLIASAMLTTLEIGARLTPNNLVPSLRWPLVGAYWIYALGASAFLAGLARRQGREVPVDKNWKVRADKSREVRVEKNQEVREEKNREVRVDKGHEVRAEESPEVVSEHDVTEPEPEKAADPHAATGDPSETGERPRLFD